MLLAPCMWAGRRTQLLPLQGRPRAPSMVKKPKSKHTCLNLNAKDTRHILKLSDIKTEGNNPKKASGQFRLAPNQLIWKEPVMTRQPRAAQDKPESSLKEMLIYHHHHHHHQNILSSMSYSELQDFKIPLYFLKTTLT